MKRLKLFLPLFIFLLLAILFWRGLSLDPSYMPSALIDKPLPEFVLPSLQNPEKNITDKDLLGRPVLLNVWATWCVACRIEHPYLVKLAEAGIPIYGINYKDDTNAAKQWLSDLHNPYVANIVDADGRLGIDLGVFGAPETYLVDKNGIIRYKHVGIVDEKVWIEHLAGLFSNSD